MTKSDVFFLFYLSSGTFTYKLLCHYPFIVIYLLFFSYLTIGNPNEKRTGTSGSRVLTGEGVRARTVKDESTSKRYSSSIFTVSRVVGP